MSQSTSAGGESFGDQAARPSQSESACPSQSELARPSRSSLTIEGVSGVTSGTTATMTNGPRGALKRYCERMASDSAAAAEISLLFLLSLSFRARPSATGCGPTALRPRLCTRVVPNSIGPLLLLTTYATTASHPISAAAAGACAQAQAPVSEGAAGGWCALAGRNGTQRRMLPSEFFAADDALRAAEGTARVGAGRVAEYSGGGGQGWERSGD